MREHQPPLRGISSSRVLFGDLASSQVVEIWGDMGRHDLASSQVVERVEYLLALHPPEDHTDQLASAHAHAPPLAALHAALEGAGGTRAAAAAAAAPAFGGEALRMSYTLRSAGGRGGGTAAELAEFQARGDLGGIWGDLGR